MASADATQRVMDLARVDLHPPHRAPAWWRVALATIDSIVLSLVADRIVVAVFNHVFPTTRGYEHFHFGDYGKLTIVGIVIAGLAWPVVARLSSAPRWLFFRLAILVTAVLLLPDLFIWHQGQPIDAVGGLMCMHVAIGVITYLVLVHLAPVRLRRGRQAEPA
ncbi:MAG TPA: hypothetical protein VGG38_12890 [Acidimicrobiales bacterium]|jgi:hypothetical protein